MGVLQAVREAAEEEDHAELMNALSEAKVGLCFLAESKTCKSAGY